LLRCKGALARPKRRENSPGQTFSCAVVSREREGERERKNSERERERERERTEREREREREKGSLHILLPLPGNVRIHLSLRKLNETT